MKFLKTWRKSKIREETVEELNMSKNVNGKRIEWERLTNVLLYGVSKVRKMPRPDKTVTLHDDLIEFGATEEETKFLIRQAKRLDIELK